MRLNFSFVFVLQTQKVVGSKFLWTHDLQARGVKKVHADPQKVSKCRTRAESEDHTREKACNQGIHTGFETMTD